MKSSKSFGLSFLAYSLAASLACGVLTPSYALDSAANSGSSDSTASYLAAQAAKAAPASKAAPAASPAQAGKPGQVQPVVVEVPFGTTKVVVNCQPQPLLPLEPGPVLPNPSMPAFKDKMPPAQVQEPGPVQPNPTMPYYQTHPLPKDAVPVVVTQCPAVIVIAQKPAKPVKPVHVFNPNVTVAPGEIPNFANPNPDDRYTTVWYPTGINPATTTGNKKVLPTNNDIKFWPNPTSLPNDLVVRVTGVFNSLAEIEQAGLKHIPAQKPTVISNFYEQFSHPQETLAKLKAVEQQNQEFNKQQNFQLEQDSRVVIHELKLNGDVYLITYEQDRPFGLVSKGVPASPANPQAFWPNPQPSLNNLVTTTGYSLRAQQTSSLDPLVALIPGPHKVANADTRGPITTYEQNSGSYSVPAPQAMDGSTQQADSPFAGYYVTETKLQQILSAVNQQQGSVSDKKPQVITVLPPVDNTDAAVKPFIPAQAKAPAVKPGDKPATSAPAAPAAKPATTTPAAKPAAPATPVAIPATTPAATPASPAPVRTLPVNPPIATPDPVQPGTPAPVVPVNPVITPSK